MNWGMTKVSNAAVKDSDASFPRHVVVQWRYAANVKPTVNCIRVLVSVYWCSSHRLICSANCFAEEEDDEDDEDGGTGRKYSIVRPSLSMDKLTEIPCGACPVEAQCEPGGVVSPETCVYFSKWLEF